MAKQPVIEIDVDDAKFKAFYDLFKKYQDDLEKSPGKMGAWNEVIASGVGAIAEQTHNIAQYMKQATDAQHQFQNATRKSGKALSGMAKDARSLAHDIFGLGKFLLKGGLWGVGSIGAGIFGLDRIASDAVQTQRSARGMGLNTGQLRAWHVNFDRYVNPDTLSKIAAAKGSTEGVAMLSVASGLSPAAIPEMSATSLDYRMMTRLRKLSKSWNPAAYQQMLQAYGFSEAGFTIEDLRRLQATRPGTLATAHTAYERDRLEDRTGRAAVHSLWLFQRELQQTGKMLGTDIQKRLSVLGPTLGGFVKALGGDAKVLINDVLSKGNLEAMQKGIVSLTRYLASGGAQKAIAGFMHAIEELGSMIHSLYKFLHPKASRPFPKGLPIGNGVSWPPNMGPFGHYGKAGFAGGHPGFGIDTHGVSFGAAGRKIMDMAGYFGGRYDAAAKYAGLYAHAAALSGVSPTLLHSLAAVESAGNPVAVSKAGARGLFQFMPSTARQFGINPDNPEQATKAAANYIKNLSFDLLRAFPKLNAEENLRATIASYNWGLGHVEKDIRRYGSQWERHTPSETRGEVHKVMSLYRQHSRRPPNVRLSIFNSTAARVAVSTNAAAQ